MPNESRPRRIVRFGVFEADLELRELRRQGRIVPLQDQPFHVLSALLEQAEREVSRDDLRRLLWPGEAFLEFDTGINTAVAKLRQALGDSADNPRFIATRPRRGYRFIAPVHWVEPADQPPDGDFDLRALTDSHVRVWWTIAAGVLIALGIVAFFASRSRRMAVEAASLDIYAPAGEVATGSFALAPDGSALALVTGGTTPADTRLWVRSVDGGSARVLAGTDGAAMPFWSPDGRRIGFFAHGKLMTVEVASGLVRSIADAPRGRGGCWSKSGLILFAPDIDSPIFSVAAAGGPAVAVTDLASEPSHRFPTFLPDGRHFLFLVLREDRDESEIWWGELDTPLGGRLLAATSHAVYLDPGYLFFARGSSLFAQAFDATGLRTIGQPLVVSDRVGIYGEDGPTGLGAFSVSDHGALALADHRRAPHRLAWFDRAGQKLGTVVTPADLMSFDVSPDGGRVAVARFDARKRSSDLLTLDLDSGVVTQVTDDPSPDSGPLWDPRGERLAFTSLREGRWRVVVRDVRQGRREQQLAAAPYVYSWFPDGSALVIGSEPAGTGIDLWKLPVQPVGRSTPLVVKAGNQTDGQISPDGRWLAYTSDHEGRREIYLSDLRTHDTRRVSVDGGDISRWRRDGGELFYLAGTTLMSVSVRSAPVQIGSPERLLDLALPARDRLGEIGAATTFGAAPDGSRFLFPAADGSEVRAGIRVIRHWSPAPPR